ncbi:cytidine deaminase [Mycetocola reblochoni]|uniref:Cytidine deaminase n=2 Tax=Mycetocola reblochoni TaxID=331618 RepID=A0A1R4JZM7_9MICO|nr:cytidine deaminase [Mycetocola reblochoni]RLP70505.1 cytidine deaminase [Mycetocola reblochoni]SJN37550.1 Cytidine deaminase [Mycetocola reblochoni REB411]
MTETPATRPPGGGPVTDEVWDRLHAGAVDALTHAYVPYSHFPVGVAALVDDGRIIAGANVENASYGVTLCAECSLVSALHMGGGGKLVAFVCIDGAEQALMPCGRCRQLLFEHAAPGMLLKTVSGIRTIDEVLPDAFGPSTLAAYAG